MKVLIIGSGDFKAPDDLSQRLVIACDGGLDHCAANGIRPDKILGDFDSVSEKSLEYFKDIPKTVYPAKKDMTDIELGMELAFELGAEDITTTGALSGTRLDHTLCNIQLLLKCLERGINARLINRTNRIELIDKNRSLCLENEGKYVSLLPITQSVEGITLTGFEYPLENFTLNKGTSLCVSNKIDKKIAKITIKKGILSVIVSED